MYVKMLCKMRVIFIIYMDNYGVMMRVNENNHKICCKMFYSIKKTSAHIVCHPDIGWFDIFIKR